MKSKVSSIRSRMTILGDKSQNLDQKEDEDLLIDTDSEFESSSLKNPNPDSLNKIVSNAEKFPSIENYMKHDNSDTSEQILSTPKSITNDYSNSSSLSSNENVDTEDTILKVTQFINKKREELHTSTTNYGLKNEVSKVSKHLPSRKGLLKEDQNGWTSYQWMQLYNYLKRWKRTNDYNMMNKEELERNFPCTIEHLKVRVKILKSMVDKKRRKQFRETLDVMLDKELSQ